MERGLSTSGLGCWRLRIPGTPRWGDDGRVEKKVRPITCRAHSKQVELSLRGLEERGKGRGIPVTRRVSDVGKDEHTHYGRS